MIDIHSHLIQENTCDGYFTHQPISYLKEAYRLGVNKIIITPIISKHRYINQKSDKLLQQFDELKKQVELEMIPIELHLGYVNDDCDSLANQLNDTHSLVNGKYVLVDFSIPYSDMDELLYNFKTLKKHLIMAHPERYDHISMKEIMILKKLGVLIQVTARLLKFKAFNKYNRKCRKLLKLGLVDFIASDGRDILDIRDLAWSYKYVQKKYGLAIAQTIFESNPSKIINNIDFEREK